MEEEVISISELVDILKKKWKLIVIITSISVLTSAILSFFVIKPVYETSVKVFVGKEEGRDEVYNSSDVTMYQQLLKTYATAVQSKDLIEDAINNTEYELSPEQVLSSLTVLPIDGTQILQMKYTSQSKRAAAVILENISDEFIDLSQDLVPNGNVRVIEEVQYPTSPISPNKTMNIAIAGLLGIMVSVGIVFLLAYMDNTYKTKERLESDLGIPVLAVINEA